MSEYDAIIVGAGHNGLTCAIELARAGKKVAIIEKTFGPGGQAATRELFPGYKHSVGAWAFLVFKEKLIKYLELDKEGFELIRPESSFTVFGNEGEGQFVSYTDSMELANHIVEEHGFDAMTGFQNFNKAMMQWKKVFDRYVEETECPTLEELISREEDPELRELFTKINYGSAMDVLREFFPNEGEFNTITGSLCASAVDGTHMGPYSKGSGLSLAYHYGAGDTYDFKIPKGGIGQLSYCLEAVAKRYGVEIMYKSPITEFISEATETGHPQSKYKVTGVELKGGEKLHAKVVVSTLDAQNTFLNKCDKSQLPKDFVSRVEDIQHANGYIQIHLALKDLPTFSGELEWVNGKVQSWLLAYIPSPDNLHESWKTYQKNEVSEDPATYFYFPSQLDSSLAPEGHHTCTLFAHYFPAVNPEGQHKSQKLLMEDRMLDRVESVAPGFRDLILQKATFTQHYFERNFGVTKGDFSSGLMHPDQMFGNRQEHSNYTTPLENLFMAGASCHPGPGVTCMPGLNGSKIVLAALNGEAQPDLSKVDALAAEA